MSEPVAVGDLPRGLGLPATRALVANGIMSLAEAAMWTEADVLALHGVGPKAVAVLNDAFGPLGLRFRGDE